MIKLKNIIFNEAPGDWAGSDTSQYPGDPYGFQGTANFGVNGSRQLAKPERSDSLVDPEEEKSKHVYGPLDQDRLPPPNPPVGPRALAEDQAGINLGPAPGMRPNILVDPKGFVPNDPDSVENGEVDLSIPSISSLLSSQNVEKAGYGPSIDFDPLHLSSHEDDGPNQELNLDQEKDGGKGPNQSNADGLKNVQRDGRYNLLVAPRQYTADSELNPMDGFNHLDDEDDVHTRGGDMGNLVAPKKYIPEPAPTYEGKMKAKESKKLNDLEKKKDFLPTGAETKKQEKAKGVSLGSVLNNDKAAPKNMKNEEVEVDAAERLQPYKGSSEVLVSPEDFTVVLEAIRNGIRKALKEANFELKSKK